MPNKITRFLSVSVLAVVLGHLPTSLPLVSQAFGQSVFLIHDTFTGADATAVVAHAPETNVLGSAWQVSGTGGTPGTPTLQGGRLTSSTDATAVWAQATISAGTADVRVATDMTLTPAGHLWGGVVVRHSDSNNFVAGFVSGTNGYIFRVQNGNWTQLAAADFGLNWVNVSQRLEMRAQGTTIQLWWNGVQKLQVTESAGQAVPRHGLLWQTSNAGTVFENFTISGAAPPGFLTSYLVSDTFTVPSGSLLANRTPDSTITGAPWQLFGTGGTSGTPTIQSGRVTTGTDATAVWVGGTVETGTANVSVGADILYGPSGAFWGGVVVRQSDANNFIAGFVSGTNVYVFKVQGGVWTQLATASVAATPVFGLARLEVRAAGSAIELWWNGVRQIQTTHTFQLGATRHGLVWLSYNGGTLFDNFEVIDNFGVAASVTRIEITGYSTPIPVGGRRTLTAQAFDASNLPIPASFTWVIANPATATAAGLGASRIVSAWSAGTTIVTATSANGVSESLSIDVVASAFLVNDPFTGSDNAPVAGRLPDISAIGNAWQVTAVGGTVGTPTLQSGHLTTGTDATAGTVTATVDTGNANVIAATDVTLGQAGYLWGGIAFRQVDAGNFLAAFAAGSNVYFYRVQGGEWLELRSSPIPITAAGTTLRIEVRAYGNLMELWWDGARRLRINEAAFQSATRHGVVWMSSNTGTSFDAFTAQISPPLPAVTSIALSTASITTSPFKLHSITAQALDAVGQPIAGLTYAWTTTDPAIATAASSGPASANVRGLSLGSATISVIAEGVSANLPVTVNTGAILVAHGFAGTPETSLASLAPELNAFGNPWIVSGPDVVLRNGGVAPAGPDSTSFESVALIDAFVSDGVVAADWTPVAAASTTSGYPVGGLVFRALDERNYFVAGYGISGGTNLAVGRVEAGDFTLLAEINAGSVLGRTPRIEVRLNGPYISIWSDGVLHLSITDTAYLSATRYGFRFWPAYDWLSTFDNFSIDGPPQATVHHVVVTPSAPVIALQAIATLTARAYDADNVVIPNVLFSWTSSDPAIVGGVRTGADTLRVTGHAYGSTTLTAIPSQGATAATVVDVVPVASVTVNPEVGYVGVNAAISLSATARDAANRPIDGVLFQWSSSDPVLAEVVQPPGTTTTTNVFGRVGETHAIITATAWGAAPSGTGTVFVQSWGAPIPYPTCVRFVTGNGDISGQGGVGYFGVIADTGCSWSITNAPSWATVHQMSGVGSGVVYFTALPNGAPSTREGTITISEHSHYVFQQGVAAPTPGCVASFATPSVSLSLQGHQRSLSIHVPEACLWTASTNVGWLHILSNNAGIGNGVLSYLVDSNPGVERSATITVNNGTFEVIQEGSIPPEVGDPGGCPILLSPASLLLGRSATTSSVLVSAPSGCAWTASTEASFLQITAGHSGVGNGSLEYTITENQTTEQRTGSIKVNNATHRILQRAVGSGPSRIPPGTDFFADIVWNEPQNRLEFIGSTRNGIVTSGYETVAMWQGQVCECLMYWEAWVDVWLGLQAPDGSLSEYSDWSYLKAQLPEYHFPNPMVGEWHLNRRHRLVRDYWFVVSDPELPGESREWAGSVADPEYGGFDVSLTTAITVESNGLRLKLFLDVNGDFNPANPTSDDPQFIPGANMAGDSVALPQTVTLIAAFTTPNGTIVAPPTAQPVAFDLAETTRFLGKAMNFGTQQTFDYSLGALTGAWLADHTARVDLLVDDYGGRTLVLASHPADSTELRLPVDPDRDGLPNVTWKTTEGPDTDSGQSGDDAELGAATVGDGLVAFEEFRGFMTIGNHVRTHSARHDLFVNSMLPEQAGDATTLGPAIHYVLQDEMGSTGQLNFNFTNSGFGGNVPSHFPQRALRIREAGYKENVAAETQPIGLGAVVPANVLEIRIFERSIRRASPPDNDETTTNPVDDPKRRQTIAHEIGHGVSLGDVFAGRTSDSAPCNPPLWTVMLSEYFVRTRNVTDCAWSNIPHVYSAQDLANFRLR